MATGQVGSFTLTSPFSSVSPATPASQIGNFAQIVGAAVSGTVAITQAIRQPTTMYPPAVAGSQPGAYVGAAQINAQASQGTSVGTIALIGAGLALVATLALVALKR